MKANANTTFVNEILQACNVCIRSAIASQTRRERWRFSCDLSCKNFRHSKQMGSDICKVVIKQCRNGEPKREKKGFFSFAIVAMLSRVSGIRCLHCLVIERQHHIYVSIVVSLYYNDAKGSNWWLFVASAWMRMQTVTSVDTECISYRYGHTQPKQINIKVDAKRKRGRP